MYKALKPVLERLLSFILLIIFSPVIITVICLIWLKLGRPVFFVQERVGKNNKSFKLYKFRSLSNACDKAGDLLPDQERMTPLGIFLRKTSLDEIPQLINILKGEMSLVGPRPLFTHYLPYYTDLEIQRHNVLPGITGWAQINGRNTTPWDKRLAMDVWYIDNQSLLLDMKIILLTIIRVFTRKDTLNSQRDIMVDFDQYRKQFETST